ncbi:hypothetical protein Tdes44962_MAKER06341 [Teratosphaeria destructans]|uniref:LYC1 C-terminal domain-containing protein n=1 Tax=Teratosphaeria destructans TaxID=418781 RepID=A0A9W7SI14_9PEZI|nr:hypothetical protein Tdes44962_MAKER06341 [Teratosphaeria destructans]
MAGSELPHRDSPDIYLVPGTPEEHAAQTIANSEEWRGALSLDAYLRREEVLLAQDLTRDGGLTAWALVYQPAQGGQRQVLCGCESIKKKALMARGGKVEDVLTHAIASVFCPPRYRSRGYAGRMMQELGPRLKTWQVEEGKQVPFSVLFSDIGKEFYAARGWQPFPSSHVALPAGVTLHESSLPSVTALRADGQDLAELCAIDERLIRRRLAKSDGSGRLAVAIVPDKVTMDWHHARQDFVATELHGGERPSFLDQGNGAMVEYEDGKRAWIIWQRVWTSPQEESPNTLHIMRLVVEDEDFSDFAAANEEEALKLKSSPLIKGIAALLARAQEVADDSYMKQIDIWNPSSTILAAAKLINGKATVVHREKESIASLMWYGESSGRDVDWLFNEKYGWC